MCVANARTSPYSYIRNGCIHFGIQYRKSNKCSNFLAIEVVGNNKTDRKYCFRTIDDVITFYKLQTCCVQNNRC